MLKAIIDAIRAKKPQLNHTVIDTKHMKKTTATKVKMEAKGKPMTKGKKPMISKAKMNKPTRSKKD